MNSFGIVLLFLIFSNFPQRGILQSNQIIRVLHINTEKNTVAEKAVDAAISFAETDLKFEKTIQLHRVVGNRNDAKSLLDSICKNYSAMLDRSEPPHVVLDTTTSGLASETVKSFAFALGLPTISSSYKRDEDLRQWRNLTDEERKYLIHVLPPADLMSDIIPEIIAMQGIQNAAVLFDDSFVMDYKSKSIPIKHAMVRLDLLDIKNQLITLNQSEIFNFFLLGTAETIEKVLNVANMIEFFQNTFAWYAISQNSKDMKCTCTNATIMHVRPKVDAEKRKKFFLLRTKYHMDTEPEITCSFYFDLMLYTITAIKNMIANDVWPKDMKYLPCDDYNGTNTPSRTELRLSQYFNESFSEISSSLAPILLTENEDSKMNFNLQLEVVTATNNSVNKVEQVGTWKAGHLNQLKITKPEVIKRFKPFHKYRIVTVEQKPFMFKDPSAPKGYSGYCIDLIDEIAQILHFDYDIYDVPSFGHANRDGEWDGVIRELLYHKADIALGSMSIMAEREKIIDYTVPYYDPVGITILMKKTTQPLSLFKFLTVLENDVWLCIFCSYVITSVLMWIFDRWSPFSYQNTKDKTNLDGIKRVFDLKECFWFCIMSLTPQGSGEPPKNLSGRLVAASWWLFGFIIVASYTANLAAFLTVSRLDTPVESLDDLSKQYKLNYAPINNSNAMLYFQRMAEIEQKFYEIWKDMSLNLSLSPVERNKLAVWEYPVSEKYTKIWQTMKESGLPQNQKTALKWVRASKSSNEGFAYLGDATDIKYLVMTNCDLQIVGEEFSRKSYALGVPEGSPLKEHLSNAILQLLHNQTFVNLKEKWWTQNPNKKVCDIIDDQTNGISMPNIGGVFIVLSTGICFAYTILVFEYFWYKHYRKTCTFVVKH